MNPVTRAATACLAAALLTTTPVPAVAQSAATGDTTLYRIEVIVFANRDVDRNEELLEHSGDSGSAGTSAAAPGMRERLFQDREELEALLSGPSADSAQTPPDAAPDQAPGEFTDRPDSETGPSGWPQAGEQDPQQQRLQQFGFRLLHDEELELGSVWNSLQRLQAYTPLLHGGWVQEGRSERQANSFDLAYLGRFNPRGTVTLHLNRFPFLTLDISYQPQLSPGDAAGGPFGEIAAGPRYVLKEERRIPRNGELHFFDHPAFGVLIVIRPQPQEPATTPDGQPAA